MLLYHAGFTNEALTPQTKEKAIQCVLLHQVFRSRREQIDDIKQGLQEGLLLNLLRSNPSCVRIVFPLSSEHVLKATDILQLIRSDSDLTEKQAQVLAWFKESVQKIENGIYVHCRLLLSNIQHSFLTYDQGRWRGRMKDVPLSLLCSRPYYW